VPSLGEIRDGWDQAAREDAMYNIATMPGMEGMWQPDDFFATGVAEIDETVECYGHLIDNWHRALDFGCGLGRGTQALAEYFDRVDGCDVSPEMVERARAFNAHGKAVEYRVSAERLPYPDRVFDFVYSRIVLQHIPDDLKEGYVGEFLRLLKRGGLAVIHIPAGESTDHWQPWQAMYRTPRETVEGWIKQYRGKLLDVHELDPNDLQYVVRK